MNWLHDDDGIHPVGAPLARYLVLDTSGDDPRWMIASISVPSDVRPAVMTASGRRYEDCADVTDWCRDQVGLTVSLVPVAASVWRIDERRGGNAGASGGG